MEEHRKLGGRIEVDVPYQYLSIFQFDDEKLYKVRDVSAPFSSSFLLLSAKILTGLFFP